MKQYSSVLGAVLLFTAGNFLTPQLAQIFLGLAHVIGRRQHIDLEDACKPRLPLAADHGRDSDLLQGGANDLRLGRALDGANEAQVVGVHVVSLAAEPVEKPRGSAYLTPGLQQTMLRTISRPCR